MKLTEENLLLFAAQNYYNPRFSSIDEFYDDLSRFKYVKRLINQYVNKKKLSERLILNHLIVIFNVFGIDAGLKICELKIHKKDWTVLKPFLVFLNTIKNDEYTNIQMDKYVIEQLRKI